MSGWDPRCHPPSDRKVEALQKTLPLKWIAVQGWSKATKVGGNMHQVLRHPQKWDPQSVDKHDVYLSKPFSRSFLT